MAARDIRNQSGKLVIAKMIVALLLCINFEALISTGTEPIENKMAGIHYLIGIYWQSDLASSLYLRYIAFQDTIFHILVS